MAYGFNAVTGRFEGEPDGIVLPRSGRILDAPPDDVAPGDLILGRDPRKPYKSMVPRSELPALVQKNAQNPNGETAAVPLYTAPGDQWGGGPIAPENLPDPNADAPPPVPAALELPPPAPAPAKPQGGGGGGPSAPPPGSLTLAETLAKGQQQSADDQVKGAVRGEVDQAAQQSLALADQAGQQEAEFAARQAASQKAREQTESEIRARSDAASKMELRDVFEGRPLAAIAAAIASGIGARAAAITGTENTAMRVLENGATAFRQKQQMLYERELRGITDDKERLERANAYAIADEAGLLRKFARDRERTLLIHGADEVRVKGDTILAKLDAGAAEREVASAGALYTRQQAAIMQQAQVASARASANASNAQAQQTRVETSLLQANGGKAIGHVEREKAEAAEASANQMARAAQMIEKDPGAWKRYQAALKAQKETDAIAKSKIGGDPLALAQYFGQSALALEQRLKGDPAALDIHSNLAPVVAAKARQLDPVGALNEGALWAGRDHLGLLVREPKDISREIRTFETDRRNQARAALGASSYQAPSAQQAGMTKAQLGTEIAKANAYLQKNPNDQEVKAHVQALSAAYGGAR
jgi:hypothetical protein